MTDLVFTDNRGTVIEAGREAVYNISGQVALGRIVSVEPGKQYWQKPNWHGSGAVGLATIKIELLHNAAGYEAGKISKVQNQKNLLVLLDGES